MSFFKRLSRKGGRHADAKLGNTVSSTLTNVQTRDQEESGAKISLQRSGDHPVVASHTDQKDDQTDLDEVSRSVAAFALDQGTSTQTVQNISISGGTVTSVGRDLINQTLIQNHYASEETRDSNLFLKLDPVPAAHDCQGVTSRGTECFPGTRRQLLHDIEAWRTGNSVPIFIIDGIAGIGKTTVVKTVCAQAAAERRLAASWFFSRDEQDRKTTKGFVRTLAFQLASYHPILHGRVTQTLEEHPDILQKEVRVQFNALVHQPLRDAFPEQGGTHVISIDAIDECDLDEATEILSILLSMIPQHPQIRLLITCRPERPFRLLLQNHRSGPQVFRLHEIETSVVESDIRLYIDYCLSPERVAETLPDLLPPPWRASAKEKEALVRMSGKLFIVASTAVKFVLDPKRLAPGKQILQLLDLSTGPGLASSPMDRLYTQVLRAAVPEPAGDWFEDYQVVVGAIVVVLDVLSIQALASLLDIEQNDIIRALSHLHSVIAPINENEAFRVHHKSFPDFVADQSRCSIDRRFFIDAPMRHFQLACSCLRVMNRMLKQNICELTVAQCSEELKKLPPSTIGRIPSELLYACTHWVSHLQQGESHFDANEIITGELETFVDKHLLSWLEVLALTGQYKVAWSNVNTLSEIISMPLRSPGIAPTSTSLSHVLRVLQDCLRLIALHLDIPQLYPMHLYHSALPFASLSSTMRAYEVCLPSKPILVSGLEGHLDHIDGVFHSWRRPREMMFSPCGEMVATSSDCLRLYSANSGSLIRVFKPVQHSHRLFWDGIFVFSPDGCFIAGEAERGVQVWEVASGETVATFAIPDSYCKPLAVSALSPSHGRPQLPTPGGTHAASPTSLGFSSDAKTLVAGTRDGTSFLWHIEGDSNAKVLKVEGQDLESICECPPEAIFETCWAHRVEDIVPLTDGRTMVTVTATGVQLWNTANFTLSKAHPRRVDENHRCPVSFSSDKQMMAIEAAGFVIEVHGTSRAHRLATLTGHYGLVTTTAFPPHSEQLCSASEDLTIRLWDIIAATQLRVISTSHILTHAIFTTGVDGFIFRGKEWMSILRLNHEEPASFGPEITGAHLIRFSPDGSTVAIRDYGPTMVSSLASLSAIHAYRISSSRSTVGFLPSGELFSIRDFRGKWEVSATRGTACFKFPAAAVRTSPDMTRLMALGEDASALVYNIGSGRQEARLGPLVDGCFGAWLWFSWDSGTAYIRRQDGFHFVVLPSPEENTPKPLSFSKCEGIPAPDWFCSTGAGPPAAQLHFLAGDCAWTLQQDRNTWAAARVGSLVADVECMAYSPCGTLVAIIGDSGPSDQDKESRASRIQLRKIPGYNLIASLEVRHSIFLSPGLTAQFLPSLPHILITHCHLTLTSWDISTSRLIGTYHLPHQRAGIVNIHPLNGSDFLCLVNNFVRGKSMTALTALQLRGALPTVVHYLCWFPPHLAIRVLKVNPRHPHMVAVSGPAGALEIDISKCSLPFVL
ncbi:hypothetical protein BKA70DRAFT_1140617 [Coprinopsis sp. MPI-PUGE-AT-0042]|nr:hypothetical protein BKA70DRAFT_1140617 [Coprinopsis sp. MPI-PUGE-AT-0042]